MELEDMVEESDWVSDDVLLLTLENGNGIVYERLDDGVQITTISYADGFYLNVSSYKIRDDRLVDGFDFINMDDALIHFGLCHPSTITETGKAVVDRFVEKYEGEERKAYEIANDACREISDALQLELKPKRNWRSMGVCSLAGLLSPLLTPIGITFAAPGLYSELGSSHGRKELINEFLNIIKGDFPEPVDGANPMGYLIILALYSPAVGLSALREMVLPKEYEVKVNNTVSSSGTPAVVEGGLDRLDIIFSSGTSYFVRPKHNVSRGDYKSREAFSVSMNCFSYDDAATVQRVRGIMRAEYERATDFVDINSDRVLELERIIDKRQEVLRLRNRDVSGGQHFEYLKKIEFMQMPNS